MTARRTQFHATYLLAAAILVAGLVFLNLITSKVLWFARWDLTADHVFTLHPATRKVLGELEDRVKVTFYISEELPRSLENLRRDTIDLLQEMRTYARNLLEYEVINPREAFAAVKARWAAEEKEDWIDDQKRAWNDQQRQLYRQQFGEQEWKKQWEKHDWDERWKTAWEKAKDMFLAQKELELKRAFEEKLGIQEQQGARLSEDKFETVRFYSGLSVRYLDRGPDLLPQYWSAQRLEAEIVQRILLLRRKHPPLLAVYNAAPRLPPQMRRNPQLARLMPDAGGEIDMGFYGILGPRNEMKPTSISENEPIPEKADALAVIAPRRLSERQLYEINKFLSRGKPVLFLVSSCAMGQAFGQATGLEKVDHGTDPLFWPWGVKVRAKAVVDRLSAAELQERRSTRGGITMTIRQFMPNRFIPRLNTGRIRSRDLFLRPGLILVLPHASPLEIDRKKLAENDLTPEVLVETSRQSALVDVPFKVKTPLDLLWSSTQESTGPYPVGVLLRGTFPFPYAGKPVPAWTGREPLPRAPGRPPPDPNEKAEHETVGPDLPPKESMAVILTSADVARRPYWGEPGGRSRMMEECYGGPMLLRAILDLFFYGPELAELRRKEVRDRPLPETTAGQRLTAKIVNIGGMPTLLILFGLVRYVKRRRDRIAYERRLASQ